MGLKDGYMSRTKKIVVMVFGVLIVFVILDFNYVWANLRFNFNQAGGLTNISASELAKSDVPANTLIVPSLGIKAPIVYVNQAEEQAYQAALSSGVGHFPGSANPGELGNSYIFGHSSDWFWKKGSYKTVFALLPRISKGAQIIVTNQTGAKFIYTVTDSKRVSGNDTSVLNQQGFTKKLLTLQTSYPVGTALARWVVVAEMK